MERETREERVRKKGVEQGKGWKMDEGEEKKDVETRGRVRKERFFTTF